MTDLKKLHDGSLYDPNESSVMAEQTQCLELLYEYNMTRPSEAEKRKDLLKKCLRRLEKAAISSRHSTQTGVDVMSISAEWCTEISI